MEDLRPEGAEPPQGGAGEAPGKADAYGGDEQLQRLAAPPYQNWWYNDTAYHVQTTVAPREYRRVRMPQALNGASPFVELPVPDHLTISPALARRLRQTYDSSDLPRVVDFDTLFGAARVAEDVDAEQRRKRIRVTMDIKREPSAGLTCDPNDHSDDPSVESGESFSKQDIEVEGDAEGEEAGDDADLLEEVSAHLDYLKDRLRRLTEERDSGNYRYRRRLANLDGSRSLSAGRGRARSAGRRPGGSGIPVRGSGEYRAATYSPHPTVDPVTMLNRQALEAIDARDYASLYDISISRVIPPEQKPRLAHMRPQAGAGTAMIKRNLAPFRPAGHLRERSVPISIQRKCLGQGRVGTAVSFGEGPEAVRSREPLSFCCQGRPVDKDLKRATGRWAAEGRPEMMRRVEPDLVSPRSRVGISDSVARKLSRSLPGDLPPSQRQEADGLRGISPAPPYSMSGAPGMPHVQYEDRGARRAGAALHGGLDGRAYELNLEPAHDGDQDPDVLKTASEILAQLRADEAHLITLMRDAEGDRTRPPAPGWFNLTGEEFTRENAQAVGYSGAGRAGRSAIGGYREDLGIIEPDSLAAGRLVPGELVDQFDWEGGVGEGAGQPPGNRLGGAATESEVPEVELPVAPYKEGGDAGSRPRTVDAGV